MSNASGKILIVSFFVVGLVAAVFSTWYLRTLRSEAVAYWGTDVALHIRDAKEIQLFRVAPTAEAEPADGSPDDSLADGALRITARSDITGAPGLTQLRLHLLDNGAFRFEAPIPDDCRWRYALRFASPGKSNLTTTLVFDPEAAILWHLESDRRVDVSPEQKFLTYFLNDVGGKLP